MLNVLLHFRAKYWCNLESGRKLLILWYSKLLSIAWTDTDLDAADPILALIVADIQRGGFIVTSFVSLQNETVVVVFIGSSFIVFFWETCVRFLCAALLIQYIWWNLDENYFDEKKNPVLAFFSSWQNEPPRRQLLLTRECVYANRIKATHKPWLPDDTSQIAHYILIVNFKYSVNWSLYHLKKTAKKAIFLISYLFIFHF